MGGCFRLSRRNSASRANMTKAVRPTGSKDCRVVFSNVLDHWHLMNTVIKVQKVLKGKFHKDSQDFNSKLKRHNS